jgi:hypothetical protein
VAMGAGADELGFRCKARPLMRKAVLLNVRTSPFPFVGCDQRELHSESVLGGRPHRSRVARA